MFDLESKTRLSFPFGESSRQDECFAMLIAIGATESKTFFHREERSCTGKSLTFVVTASCFTLSSFGNKTKKKKLKNDHAQHNELGVSFVDQVVWNTQPVRFFFLWTFCFFSRARVGLVKKKVTRNIEKKAHGLNQSSNKGLRYVEIWMIHVVHVVRDTCVAQKVRWYTSTAKPAKKAANARLASKFCFDRRLEVIFLHTRKMQGNVGQASDFKSWWPPKCVL